MTVEYREFTADEISADGNISGQVAPFKRKAMIGKKPWGFEEQIAPGAFSKTLKEGDPVMLDNHDPTKPLARKSAGTLKLAEDDNGLQVDATPADTSYARDLVNNIKAGNIRGMSFGFNVVKDAWFDDDGNPSDKHNGTQRTLREVKLVEVSPVTFPAYSHTTISARDAASAAREERAGSSKPYGNVTYADPKNGMYPIDTKKHIKAAWAFINMPKNADTYPLNGVTLSSVKAAIKVAAAKAGITISESNDAVIDAELRKLFEEALAIVAEREEMRKADPKPDSSTSENGGFDHSLIEDLYSRKPGI